MTLIGEYKLDINVRLASFSNGNRRVTLGLGRQKLLLSLAKNAYTLATCSSASPLSVSRWVCPPPCPPRYRDIIPLRHDADEQNSRSETQRDTNAKRYRKQIRKCPTKYEISNEPQLKIRLR